MSTDVESAKKAYKRGEERGRADALAGHPYAEHAKAQKLNLVVWQEGGVEDAPGGFGTTINVCVRTPNWTETVDAGEQEHVFIAPTGFRWNGTVGAQYKRINETTGGDLPRVRPGLSKDKRTLTCTYHVHLNTDDADKDVLVYTCGLEAVDGAEAGRHTDGIAQIGSAPKAKLKAEVITDED